MLNIEEKDRVNASKLNDTPRHYITNSTTLGKLLDMLNLGNKSENTPTSKQLRETAGEPIAWYPMSDSNDAKKMCILYSNGYAVYINETGQTVVWLAECKSFTFEFDENILDKSSKKPDKVAVPTEVLESMPWYTAVTLVADHQIEKNNLNRTGSRKGTRDYGFDDFGDKYDGLEAVLNNMSNKDFLSRDVMPGENPLNVIVREERVNMMMANMTEKQKTVFLLYYHERYTQQEIADILGIHQSSVRDRLAGSRKKIKDFYKKSDK